MKIHKLGAAALHRKTPGLYGDGGGLWLQVSIAKDRKQRNRSWIFRYTVGDKMRSMGLGSCDTVSLAEAREAALQCRKLRLAGIDPIQQRKEERAAKVAAAAKVMTFDQCMHAYLAAHRAKWRSHKHAQQWVKTLREHASPIFGSLPVQAIDTALVVKALERIWHDKTETASRVRARIENVLDWATVREFRQGDNPARWSGYLEKLLPSRRQLRPVAHHAAMPHRDLPAFMAQLRERQGTTPRALEFLILTAARSNEVLGARWDEIDASKIWTVPADRMKAGKTHRVPLNDRCLAILAEMQAVRRNEFVFPGARAAAISPAMMLRLLKKQMCVAATAHGFRSSFRDWCREQTNFPREIAELALAHLNRDKTEAAYARGDALEPRRKLMQAWAKYCSRPGLASATVRPIRGAV